MNALPEIEVRNGTIVIADLHLDVSDAKAVEPFARWLDALENVPRLVILGDLFDVWVGRAQERVSAAPRVLDALRACTTRGIAIDLVPGNRDFLLERSFEERTGVVLHSEGFVAVVRDTQVDVSSTASMGTSSAARLALASAAPIAPSGAAPIAPVGAAQIAPLGAVQIASAGAARLALASAAPIASAGAAPIVPASATPIVPHSAPASAAQPAPTSAARRVPSGAAQNAPSGAAQTAPSSAVRILMVHGDTLCTKDVGYQRLRRILRSRTITWLAPRVPLAVGTRVARRLRRASVKAVAAKLPDEKSIQREAVVAAAHAARAAVLVCGHAHEFRDEHAGDVRWIVLDAYGGPRDLLTFGESPRFGALQSTRAALGDLP